VRPYTHETGTRNSSATSRTVRRRLSLPLFSTVAARFVAAYRGAWGSANAGSGSAWVECAHAFWSATEFEVFVL